MHHPRGGLLDDSHIPSPQNSPESKYFSVHSATKRCVAFFWAFLAWLETVIANKEKGKLVATMGVSLNKITFFSFLLFGLNPAAANVKE